MQVYAVMRLGHEYNDEYYRPQDDGENVVAYRNKERAEAERERLNLLARDEDQTDEDGNVLDWYKVAPLEYDDDPADPASAEEVAETKSRLAAELAPVFKKFRKVKSVGWRQYTDFFNDGSPLEFRCGKDTPLVNGDDSYKAELAPVYDALLRVFENFDGGTLKAVFGDHATVTVTRDGEVKTESYREHD